MLSLVLWRIIVAFRLVWPTQFPGNTTQGFGKRPEFYKPFGLPGHEGIDFHAPSRSLIFAAADGVVTEINFGVTRDHRPHNYGRHVRLRHNVPEGEFETIYAHLLTPRDGMKVGDAVKAGDVIGMADNTGNSSGDHLHFTLKKIGATQRGESTYKLPNGQTVTYPRDIIDPTPYFDMTSTLTPVTPPSVKRVDDLRYVSDGPPLDNTVFAPGTAFTKQWTVRNAGTTEWGAGYQLTFIRNTNFAATPAVALPVARPGETCLLNVPMAAPATPGVYRSMWRAQAPDGTLFGSPVFLDIRVTAPAPGVPAPAPAPWLNSSGDGLAFLEDVTVADDTMLPAGARFNKIWRVLNNGTTNWGVGYQLAHLGNSNLASVFVVPLPALSAGDSGTISLEMTVPSAPGLYKTTWRALNPAGKAFGGELYARIRAVKG